MSQTVSRRSADTEVRATLATYDPNTPGFSPSWCSPQTRCRSNVMWFASPLAGQERGFQRPGRECCASGHAAPAYWTARHDGAASRSPSTRRPATRPARLRRCHIGWGFPRGSQNRARGASADYRASTELLHRRSSPRSPRTRDRSLTTCPLAAITQERGLA